MFLLRLHNTIAGGKIAPDYIDKASCHDPKMRTNTVQKEQSFLVTDFICRATEVYREIRYRYLQ